MYYRNKSDEALREVLQDLLVRATRGEAPKIDESLTLFDLFKLASMVSLYLNEQLDSLYLGVENQLLEGHGKSREELDRLLGRLLKSST
jgi:hypothetical protein